MREYLKPLLHYIISLKQPENSSAMTGLIFKFFSFFFRIKTILQNKFPCQDMEIFGINMILKYLKEKIAIRRQ